MSRRKKDTKFWIVLICVIAIFAMLIGSLGGFGNVVTNLKDTLGNGTEDSSDTSTNKDTGSTDTSGGNVTEPSDTSKPSTDSALYYLGAGGAVKVITEAITSTEGYVLFAFDNVHDANTKWYTTWSIDERFTSNTCCTFIPFDYGGVTLYDIDECLDYTSGASANEFETVVSCTISDIPYKHTTHQFSGVENGDTYALRMFKYTLSNGKTTVDVIAEIVQYIEYLNFSNFGFTQINNSGYIDYSGSPVTPETPETEAPDTETPDTDTSGDDTETLDPETPVEPTVYTVDGVWVFNETIDISDCDGRTWNVNHGNNLTTFGWDCYNEHGIHEHNLEDDSANHLYIYDGNTQIGQWDHYEDTSPIIDFGTTPQEVSQEFYDWLTANAVKQS